MYLWLEQGLSPTMGASFWEGIALQHTQHARHHY